MELKELSFADLIALRNYFKEEYDKNGSLKYQHTWMSIETVIYEKFQDFPELLELVKNS